MKLHQINGYIQNIYLAEYEHGLLLLDGCCRADVKILIDFIENELNRPKSDLKLVIVTHMHPDHAGGANALRKLTGCKVAMANVEGKWYSGIDGFLMRWTDLLLAHWVAKRLGKPKRRLWYSVNYRADIYLDNEQPLPEFEDWQALFTQGHTDRDLSLYHTQSNKVYVADLIVTVKGRFIPPFPVFYPNRYRASVTKVKSLNVETILLAHGGEIQFTDEDYGYLFSKMPRMPTTHWRSVKSKTITAIKGYLSSNQSSS